MKIHQTIKMLTLGSCLILLTACSSSRHGGGAGISDGGEGSYGENGAGGAYAEGYGSDSGFQPGTSCQVPGGNAQSYYFDFNSNDVHPQDLNRIQNSAPGLSGRSVQIVGNTDSRGSREYNMALGWRRANAVSSALQQAGVPKGQISTNSNGAEKPIAFGNSEDDYQCNRRVDVTS